MRKLLALLLAINIITCCSCFVYADDTQTGKGQKNPEARAEIMELKTEFLNNRIDILDLKTEILTKSSEVKSAIVALKESDTEISAEKLEAIKQGMQEVKSDRGQIKEINTTQLKPVLEEFKSAMESRDFATAKSSITEAIQIQETKIAAFEQVLTDLDSVLQLVEE
jgi:hypothetical protein